jgi:hypothetical protein
MTVPTSIDIPGGAPNDIQSIAMFLTNAFTLLQNWVRLTATDINSKGGFEFVVQGGQLYVKGPSGTLTHLAAP